MANEATLIVETALPINFTCADGTGIEKGALLRMTNPLGASAVTAANEAVAGIAAVEKIASDGVIRLAVYREGIFKVYLSGSATVGDGLVFAGHTNYVKTAPNSTTLSGSNIVGIAMETRTTGNSLLMELKPQVVRFD